MSRPNRRRRHDEARMHLISGRLREQRKRVVAPLRKGVFLVPVTITSLGLLSGFYSIVSAVSGHFELAALMIMIAFVCDGLDGRIARASRTSSQFGIEYDSLSDVVAFGVAPALLAYSWALQPLGAIGIIASGLFVVCSALRLARFNVQTGSIDKRRFVGLPVPGAAAMIAGVALAYSYCELQSPRALCVMMLPLTIALGALMISRVPYPSFKGINLQRRAQLELIGAIVVTAAFLIALPQLTVFAFSTAYVLSGPYLMLRGERLSAPMPVLRTVPSAPAPRDASKPEAAPAPDAVVRKTRALAEVSDPK
jgi:CDP-diacylglycerol---serine O-phosphatidyltransferase